ncbi:hypothetical protein ACPCHT_09785 [Nucisporomicrobium flavum]|uniref:hypothetical protein n=1 Tax=Nucisporomicrobium flavum TaxID=2785915 RepID=UPI0018F2EE1E|nr:hypothetical protein [Nucisporomicrobium flavum]
MIGYPGRPVEGSTVELAERNMREFVATLREQLALEVRVHGHSAEFGEPVRDRGLDGAGRYGWSFSLGRARVSVLMPGVEPARLAEVASSPAYVHVNGCPVPWAEAVHHTVALRR